MDERMDLIDSFKAFKAQTKKFFPVQRSKKRRWPGLEVFQVKHYKYIKEVRSQTIHNSSLIIIIIHYYYHPWISHTWFRLFFLCWGSQYFSPSIVSTCQQAHQMIFMIGQKYPTGLFPAGLTGSRASRTRVCRGSRTKAAFVSESANHLIIKLTSQVWPREVWLGSLLPCAV